jgi:hypothetical protein
VTRLVERSFPGVTSGWASANSPTRRSCSYVRPSKETTFPILEKDRCSIPFRQRSQFGEMRQVAIQCQQNFLAHREQVGHGH